MMQKLLNLFRPLAKPLVAIALILVLCLSHANAAWAARGGRIGGGSFRAPSRTYAPPSRTYAPSGGGYYPGGGFGFPFLLPFFGFGGGFGGLFSILIFIAIANFLVRSVRNFSNNQEEQNLNNPVISVARLQVGLLSQARELQADLDRLAQKANTGSTAGLTQVLQETSLALLRHPDYWIYGATESRQTRLEGAEAEFNRFVLTERSKFTEETLSNVNNQIKQASPQAVATEGGPLAERAEPGEYIVVTMIVGTQGKLELPTLHSAEELRQAIETFGAVSSDQLLALEILWTPQAEGDVLTREEMIRYYPNLRLV